jgi:hypothetical protein
MAFQPQILEMVEFYGERLHTMERTLELELFCGDCFNYRANPRLAT